MLGHIIKHRRIANQEYERLYFGKKRRTLERDLKARLEQGLLSEAGTAPTDPTQHDRLADGFLGSGIEL